MSQWLEPGWVEGGFWGGFAGRELPFVVFTGMGMTRVG